MGEIKENVPSSAKLIAVTGSQTLDETFSNKIISQTSQNSNAFDKKSAKDFKNEGRSALHDADYAEILNKKNELTKSTVLR